MKKPCRYQIRVAGYTPDDYISETRYDLGNRWLDLIGTIPELYMVDTTNERWLTSEEIAEVTGLNGQLIDEICRLRMNINVVYGDAIRTRKHTGE